MSGDKSYLLEEFGERGIEALKCLGAAVRAGRGQGRGGPKATSIDTHIQDGHAGAEGREAITVSVGHTLDESMEPQPTQVVRQLAGRIVIKVATEQLRDRCAHVAMAKAGGAQRKETERLHEGEDAAVPEAERGGALGVDDDGLGQGVEAVVADEAVVAQIFDA